MPHPGLSARCAPDPILCYFESRGRGRGWRESCLLACLQAPRELWVSVGATLARPQVQVLWGAPRGPGCRALALPAPAALACAAAGGSPG